MQLMLSEDKQHVGIVMSAEEAARLYVILNYSAGNALLEKHLGEENFLATERLSGSLHSLLSAAPSVKARAWAIMHKGLVK